MKPIQEYLREVAEVDRKGESLRKFDLEAYLDEAADRIDELVAEKFNLMCQVAALQKDAERYRWIRVGNSVRAIMGWFSETEQWVRSSSRHADKVIDDAIAAEKELK